MTQAGDPFRSNPATCYDEPGHPRRSRQATLVVSFTSYLPFMSMMLFSFSWIPPSGCIRWALWTSLSRRARAL